MSAYLLKCVQTISSNEFAALAMSKRHRHRHLVSLRERQGSENHGARPDRFATDVELQQTELSTRQFADAVGSDDSYDLEPGHRVSSSPGGERTADYSSRSPPLS